MRTSTAEVVVFGRLVSAQKYDFAAYESDLVIADDAGRLLYEEAYRLTPGSELRAALGDQGAMATVYVLGAAAERFDAAQLPDEPLFGCSRLPNDAGVIAPSLAASLSRALAFVDRVLAAGCY